MAASEKSPDQAELADAFVTASRALLGIAIRSINAAPVAVTVPQHRVLVLLAARGPLTVGSLAEELGVNPSNASRLCDRLQRLDLVRRGRSSLDGRAIEISLSACGKAVLDAVTEHRRQEIAAVLERLPGGGAGEMVAVVHAFNVAAEELEDRDWVSSA